MYRNAFQKPSLPNQRGEKFRSQSRETLKKDAQSRGKVKLSDDDELSMIQKNPDINDQSMQSSFYSKPPLSQTTRPQAFSRLQNEDLQPSAASYA